MSSAICFNLAQSNILSSGNGLAYLCNFCMTQFFSSATDSQIRSLARHYKSWPVEPRGHVNKCAMAVT